MSGHSQNDWKAGYIIKNSGDTVFGWIENRDSKANSNHCYFRKDEVSKTIQYGPTELSGYRFNDGKFYVSKNIADEDTIRKLFLEFLIEGKVNVFHYQDDNSHFLLEKDGKIYDLKNTTVISDIDGKVYYENKKEYLGIMSLLLKDANIQPLINKSTLNSKSLIKIAKNYHEKVCSDEQCIIYEKKIKPVHVNFGLHIGESINRFNFGDQIISNYSLSNYLGCRFEFENILNYAENLFLQVDFTFQNFSKYNFKNQNQYAYAYIKNNIDLKAVALKIPVVVNYTFSKGKVRPSLGLGISNTVVLSQNKDFNYAPFYNEFNKSIPTYSMGIVGRVGCKYLLKNKHALYSDLNIDYSRTLNINQYLRLTNNLFSFSMGYTL